MWPEDLVLSPHIGHKGSWTTFFLKRLSFVGRELVHRRQRKVWTTPGTPSFQILPYIPLAVEGREDSPAALTHLFFSMWYALRTEKRPLEVPCQMSLSGCPPGLTGMLQILWASSGLKMLYISLMIHQADSSSIRVVTFESDCKMLIGD